MSQGHMTPELTTDDLAQHRRILKLDGDGGTGLSSATERLSDAIPTVLDNCYTAVLDQPELSRFFGGDQEAMDSAKNKQSEPWLELVRGEFGEDFLDATAPAGKVHADTQQAFGVEEVSRSKSHMDSLTQQNSVMVDETDARVQSLNQAVIALKDAIGTFKNVEIPHSKQRLRRSA